MKRSSFKNKYLLTVIAIIALVSYSFIVYAAAPQGGYTPGGTLDPDCAPGEQDCVVTLPSSGSTGLIGSTSGVVSSSTAQGTTETFLGENAGSGASTDYTVMIGHGAGVDAVNANSSIFLGSNAGSSASDAAYSNFLGSGAGSNSSSASYSNFFGANAGSNAFSAYSSNFFGPGAGAGATNAYNSQFIGAGAGNGAQNAADSIFIGTNAGASDTTSGSAILIGENTSTGGHSNSIGLGNGAVNTADNQFYVADSITNFNLAGVNYNFPTAQGAAGTYFVNNGSGTLSWSLPAIVIGTTGDTLYSPTMNAGQGQTVGGHAGHNIFLGTNAGAGASLIYDSVFLGYYAGNNVTGNAQSSTFIGSHTGEGATDANGGSFYGNSAGRNASSANSGTFIGSSAGSGSTYGSYSTFIGAGSGQQAVNAADSTFLGNAAGSLAANAAHSIFIGYQAGSQDIVDNTLGGTSIVIGDSASTGGFSNSIALGAGVTNTATNQFVIGSNSGVTQSPIDQTVINGSGSTSCTITTGTGMSCSSDQRLKTNITDLATNTLDTLSKVRTVTFNWNNNPTSNQNIGFLAQDIQQYYPQLVSVAPNGYLQVNYAGITPVLVESIRELNLKLTTIQTFATSTDTTFLTMITNWLASATNGIANIFSKTVTTNQLCVSDANGQTCLNRSQIDQIIQNQNQGSVTVVSGGSSASPQPSTSDATTPSTTSDPTVTPPVSDPSQPAVTDPVVTPAVTTPDPSTVVTPSTDTLSTPAVTTSSTDTSSTDTTVTQ